MTSVGPADLCRFEATNCRRRKRIVRWLRVNDRRAAWTYRLATGVSALGRLVLLAPILMLGDEPARSRRKANFSKWRSALSWSVGRQKWAKGYFESAPRAQAHQVWEADCSAPHSSAVRLYESAKPTAQMSEADWRTFHERLNVRNPMGASQGVASLQPVMRPGHASIAGIDALETGSPQLAQARCVVGAEWAGCP